jgi:hypothetical protein
VLRARESTLGLLLSAQRVQIIHSVQRVQNETAKDNI